ncbi:heterokaryon incompatibility protein-domain-containing protein [Microdochium trichocladiopsis]|uniref:Heterokaryon incompatibility protein-domain-containing protein n=1 Tax=Microdochium trichocladiopsis TaxID=1682393 RepID=A0A9P9BTC0_9PEZI|nr:heterokaryon incompatibility protein-domain-containing protein [Microdochium trichocladiopsis]KAH7039821.1 heterokaryon incompatibility protein-domain-containing protein [Microdochium trichocladiopsis]
MASPRYRYQPVLPNQIRVLHLLPGIGREPLAGQLEPLTLPEPDAAEPLPFEALSYVWGGETKSHALDVAGQSIPVTVSLQTALVRLRHADRRRVIWADAICINQDDVSEKEAQVSLMGRIFSSATQVIADLGDASNTSDAALDLIDRHWRTVLCSGALTVLYGSRTPVETAAIMNLPPEAVDMAWTDHELPGQESHEWESICEIIQRPWFSRIWIVQEFVLAREVTFHCGTRVADWRHLLALFFDFNSPSAFDALVTRWQITASHTAFIQRHEMVSRIFHNRCIRLLQAKPAGRAFLSTLPQFSSVWTRSSWVDLLYSYRYFNCTIERDRYYALVSMASDRDVALRPELRPDYVTEDNDLRLAMGKLILQLPGGAEAFMHSGLQTQTNPQVQSWMQTFGRMGNATTFSHSDFDQASKAAGNDSSFSLSTLPGNPGTIALRGYRIGNIVKKAGQALLAKEDEAQSADEFRKARLSHYLGSALDLFSEELLDQAPYVSPSKLDWWSLEAMAKAFALNPEPSVPTAIAVGFAVDTKLLTLGLLSIVHRGAAIV